MHADPDLEPAVGRHPHLGLLMAGHHRNAPAGIDRRAVGGLFAIDRQTRADHPAVRLAGPLTFPDGGNVDHRRRALHGFLIITPLEMLFAPVLHPPIPAPPTLP